MLVFPIQASHLDHDYYMDTLILQKGGQNGLIGFWNYNEIWSQWLFLDFEFVDELQGIFYGRMQQMAIPTVGYCLGFEYRQFATVGSRGFQQSGAVWSFLAAAVS
ncbi:hypothetical protein LXL04_017216 [Taraxacum kok-saghyz]